jgi:serine/threonine protein kinase
MDFIVQNPERIFFIMRFIQGGELFTILRDESKISEERAKLYTFNIALALGYLH